MNLYASDVNVYGIDNCEEVKNYADSVYISYDDLRVVNSKLTELKYEKEINTKLKEVIENDKIIINDYEKLNKQINKDCKKVIMQRNICIAISIVSLVFGVVMLVK